MRSKVFEVRDAGGTFIPVLATLIEPEGERERYVAMRAGYDGGLVDD